MPVQPSIGPETPCEGYASERIALTLEDVLRWWKQLWIQMTIPSHLNRAVGGSTPLPHPQQI